MFMSDSEAYTCIGCGLYSEKVEAGGIHYCPNPCCSAVGANWFRTKLKSCKERKEGISIETGNYLAEATEYLETCESTEIAILGDLCISSWAKKENINESEVGEV